MQDAWRAYLELALGLTEASKKKAQGVARKLVGQSGATAAQLQGLAEELMSAGLANREALVKIVRFEVDRALGMVGLATADEVAALHTRVRELERELREAEGRASAATPAGPAAAEKPSPGPAKKAIAKSTPAGKAVATTGTAMKKAVVKKAVAKKATRSGTTGGPERPETSAKRVEARKLPPPPGKKAVRKAMAKKTAADQQPRASEESA